MDTLWLYGLIVRLDSNRLGAKGSANLRHVAVPYADSTDFPVRFWFDDSLSDSIRISLGTGFADFRLVVLPTTDKATGFIIGFPENASASGSSPVTLDRLSCPARIMKK
jgi:hypothetical protein